VADKTSAFNRVQRAVKQSDHDRFNFSQAEPAEFLSLHLNAARAPVPFSGRSLIGPETLQLYAHSVSADRMATQGEALQESSHGVEILGQHSNCFEMWWPGTELNRRRQPFQNAAFDYFQRFTSRRGLP